MDSLSLLIIPFGALPLLIGFVMPRTGALVLWGGLVVAATVLQTTSGEALALTVFVLFLGLVGGVLLMAGSLARTRMSRVRHRRRALASAVKSPESSRARDSSPG